MKPLKRSAIRTELAKNLLELMGPQEQQDASNPAAVDGKVVFRLSSEQIAAIVGGAVEQAIADVFDPEQEKEVRTLFWRYFNHNLWNLTRSLRASNLLGKV